MQVVDLSKKQKAFRMKLEGRSVKDIAQEVKVSTTTLNKWENGWVDKQGRRHPGWKEELNRLLREQEEDELQCGLMLKKERLKTYDKLAQLAVNKIEENFPEINAKTAADIKGLISEVRELCRLISIESGQYAVPGTVQLTGSKQDMSLLEIEERYRKASIQVIPKGKKDIKNIIEESD